MKQLIQNLSYSPSSSPINPFSAFSSIIFVAVVRAIEATWKSGFPLNLDFVSDNAAIQLGGNRVMVKNQIKALLSTQELNLKQLEREPMPLQEKRYAIVTLVSQTLGLNPMEAQQYLQQAPEIELEDAPVMERRGGPTGSGDNAA